MEAPYDDAGYLGSRFREWRHNPCLMEPVSLMFLLLFGVFMLITLLLQAPTLLLGLLLSPVLTRSSWYVQFLYSWDIAKNIHLFLIRSSRKPPKADDKNRGFHSRTVEQRVEVVPGRVAIHPIPQFLDNLGYLIVCVPKSKAEKKKDVVITVDDQAESIIGIMVDCGEASATIRMIELIEQQHYGKKKIQIHAILCTHRHHDHVSGNAELMSHEMGSAISRVYSGAVERAPKTSHPLVNGEKLDLPKSGSNDMNELVAIEAVAVPAHTRGSLVYRLSCKEPNQPEFLFTGDTLFSAGAGVPFEADVGSETEGQLNQSHGNTFFRANLGQYAMERCFAEILSRAMPDGGVDSSVTEKMLIFPGHEYTAELLARQFHGSLNEACRWKNFVPRDFFDTVSHLYVALHRRSLPHNSGKLLLVPSTLSREIRISPHFRSLRRSGELVVRAISFWYDNFCKDKQDVSKVDSRDETPLSNEPPTKTTTTLRKWNVHADEVRQDVFTTLYTSDLDSLIDDLMSGAVTNEEAARRLRGATSKLEDAVVNKRAIPGFVPSDKSIYRGISGLVLLGSPPSAMCLADSRTMKLPPPIDSNSDRIMISMKRLILVLGRLGLTNSSDGNVSVMIKQLWKEANHFITDDNGPSDVESTHKDEIELGILKWVIYGVPSNQPSWFSKVCCMPCSKVPEERKFPDHPISKMKRKVGDLVSHDVLTCALCRTATGCILIKSEKEEEKKKTKEPGPDRLEFPSRETRSFNSFADYARDSGALEMMGGLASLLKEHE